MGNKDITGLRFGKLVAIAPTDKRERTDVVWRFRCDCGKTVERTRKHLTDTSSCGCANWASLRKDITGQRFGKLVALQPVGKKNGEGIVWAFQCDCGNVIHVPVARVTRGNTTSCGCSRDGHRPNYEDLTGQRFGSLTVIEEIKGTKKRKSVQWLCQCTCGNQIIVTTQDLHSGHKRSCGCAEKLYCVYQHLSPDNKRYIGITSDRPRSCWLSGSKYKQQYAFYQAIEANGGFSIFLESFSHLVLLKNGDWLETDGDLTYEETNYFTKKEAESLKRKYISQYDTMNPEFGYNATSGGSKDYEWNDSSKQRLSHTQSGVDNRTDWKVYRITNKVNGKVYFGITCQDPVNRWQSGRGYKYDRVQGRSNTHLWHAIEKYGWDNFEHLILHTGLTLAQAAEIEKRLIAEYDSTDPEKGYNVTKGGEGVRTTPMSAETKARLSEIRKKQIQETGFVNFKGKHHTAEAKETISRKAKARYENGAEPSFKGQHHSAETKRILSEKNSKTVSMYSVEGQRIRTFKSVSEAARNMGLKDSSISACVHHKSKTSAGYIWRLGDVEQLAPEEIPNLKHAFCKKVEQLDLDRKTVLHRYDSLAEAAAAVGLSGTAISDAIHHRRGKKQAGGYVWRYIE